MAAAPTQLGQGKAASNVLFLLSHLLSKATGTPKCPTVFYHACFRLKSSAVVKEMEHKTTLILHGDMVADDVWT